MKKAKDTELKNNDVLIEGIDTPPDNTCYKMIMKSDGVLHYFDKNGEDISDTKRKFDTNKFLKNYSIDGYKNLSAAIIAQTVDDMKKAYIKVVLYPYNDNNIAEFENLKRIFFSEHFQIFFDKLDPTYIYNRLIRIVDNMSEEEKLKSLRKNLRSCKASEEVQRRREMIDALDDINNQNSDLDGYYNKKSTKYSRKKVKFFM